MNNKQRQAVNYSEALKAKYASHPQIRRIARHRQVMELIGLTSITRIVLVLVSDSRCKNVMSQANIIRVWGRFFSYKINSIPPNLMMAALIRCFVLIYSPQFTRDLTIPIVESRYCCKKSTCVQVAKKIEIRCHRLFIHP